MTRRRLRVRVRECIDLHEAKTGRRLTYADLAKRTGMSEATIKSLASRPGYNATIRTIERLCIALGAEPADLLGWD
jgi:putative transcriptional regulator